MMQQPKALLVTTLILLLDASTQQARLFSMRARMKSLPRSRLYLKRLLALVAFKLRIWLT